MCVCVFFVVFSSLLIFVRFFIRSYLHPLASWYMSIYVRDVHKFTINFNRLVDLLAGLLFWIWIFCGLVGRDSIDETRKPSMRSVTTIEFQNRIDYETDERNTMNESLICFASIFNLFIFVERKFIHTTRINKIDSVWSSGMC